MLHVVQLSFCICLLCFNVSSCLLECMLLVIFVFFVVVFLPTCVCGSQGEKYFAREEYSHDGGISPAIVNFWSAKKDF